MIWGQRSENLSFLQKLVKTKPKQLVTLNFQGKHVIMCFRSGNLGHVIWGHRSKNLLSLQQLITTKSRKLEFSNFQCNCVTLWHYPNAVVRKVVDIYLQGSIGHLRGQKKPRSRMGVNE